MKQKKCASAILDDMGTPLDQLCGLLGVLCHLDNKEADPDPKDLSDTMYLLHDLATNVKQHYLQYYECLDETKPTQKLKEV
jgi:hypothetical protein